MAQAKRGELVAPLTWHDKHNPSTVVLTVRLLYAKSSGSLEGVILV